MNEIDPIRASKVWQRVRGESQPVRDRALDLAAELAALLQALSARLSGKGGAVCRTLWEQTQHTGAALRGIAAMEGRAVPEPGHPGSFQGTSEAMLRRSIQTAGQLARALSADPPGDFAPVRDLLKARTHQTQTQLLELLGKMTRQVG